MCEVVEGSFGVDLPDALCHSLSGTLSPTANSPLLASLGEFDLASGFVRTDVPTDPDRRHFSRA